MKTIILFFWVTFQDILYYRRTRGSRRSEDLAPSTPSNRSTPATGMVSFFIRPLEIELDSVMYIMSNQISLTATSIRFGFSESTHTGPVTVLSFLDCGKQ